MIGEIFFTVRVRACRVMRGLQVNTLLYMSSSLAAYKNREEKKKVREIREGKYETLVVSQI